MTYLTKTKPAQTAAETPLKPLAKPRPDAPKPGAMDYQLGFTSGPLT
ncbi:hypothetical protein [Rhodophyticola porphyridii]|nr:hypothetical protein [Rhodophyticola porphyridii]